MMSPEYRCRLFGIWLQALAHVAAPAFALPWPKPSQIGTAFESASSRRCLRAMASKTARPVLRWGWRVRHGARHRPVATTAQSEGDDMAMEMKGEVVLPASRDVVWAKLNDPEILKACIPAVHTLDRTSDTTFSAAAKMKIGPVSATFKGRVELTNIDPPNGYRISGEGEGGIAGFAKGGADVTLTDVPEGTRLSYDVQASVGGKIAQMGSRLIAGVAKKTADRFFISFAAECAKGT